MAKIVDLDSVTPDDDKTLFLKGDHGCLVSRNDYGVVLTDRKGAPLIKGYIIDRGAIYDIVALLQAAHESLD